MTNHDNLRARVIDTARTWHTQPSDDNLRAHMIAINQLKEAEAQSYVTVQESSKDGRIDEIYAHKVSVYVMRMTGQAWVVSIRDESGDEVHLKCRHLSIDNDPPAWGGKT